MKKLLFVVNVDWFFLSHRLPIAIEAVKQGYEVHVAMTITDKLDLLRSYNFTIHPLTVKRGSTKITDELRTFREILLILRKVRPHIVHLVTIKPVLWGGIAARLTGVPCVIAAISGLGFVFLNNGRKAAFIRHLVVRLYRLALCCRNIKIICQNPDDYRILANVTGLEPDKFTILPGSGVDLSEYEEHPILPGKQIVIMAARLLRDKGVCEFAEAARILRHRGIVSEFWLVGEPDLSNPASIKESEISVLRKEGILKLFGHRTDIACLFSQASFVVLPSYYREGLPKVLIEAAACGRAVVTTDLPGCRDAIVPGETGLLVPPRDAKSLADTIQFLLLHTDICEKMGKAGRKLAKDKFSIENIVSSHLKIYNDLLENCV